MEEYNWIKAAGVKSKKIGGRPEEFLIPPNYLHVGAAIDLLLSPAAGTKTKSGGSEAHRYMR